MVTYGSSKACVHIMDGNSQSLAYHESTGIMGNGSKKSLLSMPRRAGDKRPFIFLMQFLKRLYGNTFCNCVVCTGRLGVSKKN